jgi:hypothetical protein
MHSDYSTKTLFYKNFFEKGVDFFKIFYNKFEYYLLEKEKKK